ncbi:MAG: hypothetical protein COT43_11015 [Candidatus Marinimicrobia bacterium CG08_land_8_20_14_0_20_45_22]|nr:MAG: hypothetical protein COT43_11015 [Candidatus Marinimicrobia bacterium CG08_land_8_20_14_0_20_45_22]
MEEKNRNSVENVSRRDFLKKMAAAVIFTTPTIQTFKLLQTTSDPWNSWTGHGHHHHKPPPPPPVLPNEPNPPQF